MPTLKRTELIWGVAGLALGALLFGAAVGVAAYTGVIPSPATQEDTISTTNSETILRVFLPPVKDSEIETAINLLSKKEQRTIREGVQNKTYQLLWLTIWDWDKEAGEDGNTISITSDEFRRIVTLNGSRTRTVIPRPRSGYVEFRGEASEDGNIAIALLSATHPLALPSVAPGRVQKIWVR